MQNDEGAGDGGTARERGNRLVERGLKVWKREEVAKERSTETDERREVGMEVEV